ncbi:hypothetical protein [Corynebacterium halotolerans]|uniref:Uncharacterized protein n=1 Tax=Corynebacterium halotolerans YIM 70093 = DSM 44683 TaxID=1121362 RepID=M1NU56_9CORY|nr:hypothetical protein [Corynebacterium halotolerans]AGF71025.1 hypothetical protein A605_00035 [Corynebacterium halotolerans YIM 70093 = DSM 44683]
MIPGLTPEQLLLIADEFARVNRVEVRSFAALAQAAATPGAHFAGVPVFADVAAARAGLEDAVRLLEPLTGRNNAFASVCGEVYEKFAAAR